MLLTFFSSFRLTYNWFPLFRQRSCLDFILVTFCSRNPYGISVEVLQFVLNVPTQFTSITLAFMFLHDR